MGLITLDSPLFHIPHLFWVILYFYVSLWWLISAVNWFVVLYVKDMVKKIHVLYSMQASFASKLHISLRKSLPMFSAVNGKTNDLFVIIKANQKGKEFIAILNKMYVALSEHHLFS